MLFCLCALFLKYSMGRQPEVREEKKKGVNFASPAEMLCREQFISSGGQWDGIMSWEDSVKLKGGGILILNLQGWEVLCLS